LRQAEAQADCLTEAAWMSSSIVTVYLWFGCDGNLNVSTLFELHIIAMFIG
jgi:hypothetical protein